MFNNFSTVLSTGVGLYILSAAIGLIVGAAAALTVYWLVSKNKIGSVRKSANKLVEDAIKDQNRFRQTAFRFRKRNSGQAYRVAALRTTYIFKRGPFE